MKILSKLFRKYFPREFTHNPEDFVIQPIQSWFSPDFYQVIYSANKGESWKYLMQVNAPLFDYDYRTLIICLDLNRSLIS